MEGSKGKESPKKRKASPEQHTKKNELDGDKGTRHAPPMQRIQTEDEASLSSKSNHITQSRSRNASNQGRNEQRKRAGGGQKLSHKQYVGVHTQNGKKIQLDYSHREGECTRPGGVRASMVLSTISLQANG